MEESTNYIRVAEAIRYLADNYKQQPSLEQIAQHLNLSSYHFQRIFTEWAGISPKKFLQYLTVGELKKELQHSSNLSQAAESVGLSTQSRVYDLFVNIEAVTPQQFKTSGRGIEIEYGFHDTPFGTCFIANTKNGICSLSFTDDDNVKALSEFKQSWNNADLSVNQSDTKKVVNKLFYEPLQKHKFELYLRGTNFQIKVWEALLKIPFGSVTNYQNIASLAGHSGASRAVGSAVGKNPVAYLIPCHRVIRNEGLIGQYRWGSIRKSAIIGWEKAINTGNQ
jgi:AraC family transcriptional regulator, regulatory protein of adaptative response / methylated-DNA-[protein]-cysteine methyltransferase